MQNCYLPVQIQMTTRHVQHFKEFMILTSQSRPKSNFSNQKRNFFMYYYAAYSLNIQISEDILITNKP